ncbi:tripartite tricarboxylate transporter TctB family protein [Salinicola endophyticus]|uniref:Tripartite tricarboxylate transporter TctB family protein n=1 Tax=Salinicola endophyticus TaxID=1949083 RepID=A0ABY8FBB8_9GAMM|nr:MULTISPECIES: tripartite tricarboxylate transporter TctB family protein [Salinicola]WFF40070.1 tripartite tricarboxylate transporter TctB family protein [Salinicola endophyticus]
MRDFLLGLAFAIGGGVVIAVAQTYPTMPSLQYGPSLFPSLIGGGMLIGGALLALSQVRVLAARRHAPEDPGLSRYDYRGLALSLVPCALIVFYILAAETLGAGLCMLLSMWLLMLIRGAKWWLALGVALVVSLIVTLLFSRYLLIPLPEGVLLPQSLAWIG